MKVLVFTAKSELFHTEFSGRWKKNVPPKYMYDGTGVFSSTHIAVVPTCVVKAETQPKIAKISHENLLSKILSVRNQNNIFAQN